VRVTVAGTRAESLAQYLKKGSRVYVDGRLEARPWTDQQGQARAGLEVMANEVQFMSSRADDGRTRDGTPHRPEAENGGAPASSAPRPAHGRAGSADDADVDLPF
jgi:single-strand DNA-binding protein